MFFFANTMVSLIKIMACVNMTNNPDVGERGRGCKENVVGRIDHGV
jgi:hypothetical protein